MPEVVDMLDDDSNDGGITIDLLSLDSDDEVEIVENDTSDRSTQENRRKEPNQVRNKIDHGSGGGSNNTDGDGDDDSVEIIEKTPTAPQPVGTNLGNQSKPKQKPTERMRSTQSASTIGKRNNQTSSSSCGSNTAASTDAKSHMNYPAKKRKRPGTPLHSLYPTEKQSSRSGSPPPATSLNRNHAQQIRPETDSKRPKDGNQWLEKAMERVLKQQANPKKTQLQSVAIANTFKTSAVKTTSPLSKAKKDTSNFASLSSTLLGLSPEQEKSWPESSNKNSAAERPRDGEKSSSPVVPRQITEKEKPARKSISPKNIHSKEGSTNSIQRVPVSRESPSKSNDRSPKPTISEGRKAQSSDLKRPSEVSKKLSSDSRTETVVPGYSDSVDDAEKALRMSRDRQYAIFLNQKWNHENPSTMSSTPKPQTEEVIDLIEDDSDGSDSTTDKPAMPNKSERAPSASKQKPKKSSEKQKKTTTEEGKGEKPEAQQKGEQIRRIGKPMDRVPLYHRYKQQMEGDSYGLSTESSSNSDSESSQWRESNEKKDQTKSRSKGKKSTVTKKMNGTGTKSGRGLQRAPPPFSEPQPFDFTGKEISKKHQRHRSLDERESRQISIETGDVETNDTASHQQLCTSHSISTENTMASMALVNPVKQRKPPPPLADSEAVEHTIADIDQKMHLENKVKKQNILRNALMQHETRTQQSPSSRIIFPRVAPNSTKRKDKMKYNRRPSNTDGHTAIVNSSLTVLTTVNDSKAKEETEQQRVHENAQALSLMPYEFKRLQQQCTDILNALPFDQRYHPQVHELVSEKLYTAPKKSNAKLEIPTEFKYAPDRDKTPPTKTIETPKNYDESNENYVSVMNSFRDFCVQCKTFDCQFHITNYPDAATQACVAYQYDKRALQRQSRMPFQLNHNDPYSYLIPTTEGTFALFNGGNFDVFDKPPSVNVIDSDGSTQPISFENDNRICPFCKFDCHTQEKLYKHIGRYHQDTFYCREVGSTFEATVRTQEKETMMPQREYFHSRSLIPIQKGHYDRDSDDESYYSWYHDYREEILDELTDVSDKEKRIQTMWNRCIGCSPVIIPDKHVPKRCFLWIWKHHTEMNGLEWEMYQLLITFWERRLLNVSHIEKLIHLLHIKRNDKDQNEEPLTPRRKVIFSRLHLIFQSFGGDAKARLRKALRINTKGNMRILQTPMLPEHLWPKWTKNKTITVAIRMRSEDIARPFFFPCHHTGKCSLKNGCTCIENDYVCTKHCVWGEFGDNFFPGCNCKGDCRVAKHCPCRDAVRECDPDICGCAASTDGCLKTCGCSNMEVSLAKKASLFVGQSEVKGAGLGLFTKYPLKKGDYIDEYIGEFIFGKHQLGRSEEYYFDHSDDYIMDATHQGNKTRYLNHSLNPNIEAGHRFVNGEKRIAFYAKQNIPAQTELFYSYGKSYNKIWRSKGLDHLCVDSDDDGYIHSNGD